LSLYVKSICDYLNNPTGGYYFVMNEEGCDNNTQVLEACGIVGITEDSPYKQICISPNPFTTTTTIEYELTEPSHIQLTIYNAIGEMIQVAEDRLMLEGKHSFVWSPESLPEGMYYAVLRSEEIVSVLKMIKQ